LFAAFGDNAASIVCYCTCGQVESGGFGGAWHHDAASVLAHPDGTACDWLALYYLSPICEPADIGHPWLEVALTDDASDAAALRATFCTLALERRELLLLRNDDMLHRTPRLTAVTAAPSRRRFLYAPFAVFDAEGTPLRHLHAAGLAWTASELHADFSAHIARELKTSALSFEQYIDETFEQPDDALLDGDSLAMFQT
jgi:hypothetical protein